MSENSNLRRFSSRWIQEFDREIMRKRHVLLYGNVNDHFLCDGEYRSIHEALLNFGLANRGFEIVLKYDPIDSFQFADPTMEPLFDSVRRREEMLAAGVAVGGHAPPFPPPTQGNSSSEDQRRERMRMEALAQPKRPTDVKEAFTQIRSGLRQSGTSLAAIVDLTDMMTRESNTFEESERSLLMLLKKCTLDAAILKGSRLADFRNTLVLIGGDLKRIPEWLYRDNPYIGLIQVDRPDKEERRQFALQFGRHFRGGDAISDQRPNPATPAAEANLSPLDCFADEFADLTDGMQTMELEALRLTSYGQPDDVQPGKLQSLIDYFKFGSNEDPWEKLNADKVATALETLSKRVIGQPEAVEAAVSMLTRARVGLSMSSSRSSGKPKGIFFFVGPTGVGKTELAKALTGLVFSDERAFARFDMSEYSLEHAAEKLTGSPPGYVGHEQGGQLTDRVRQHPHSILLFDEIEKAHPRVLDKFLQILEDGRLTDGRGETAYFNQTAIIFTSNRGASSVLEDKRLGVIEKLGVTEVTDNSPSYEDVKAHFNEEVNWYFRERIGRSELRGRLGDNIIVFDLLRPKYIRDIGEKFLKRMADVASDKFHLTLEFDQSIQEMLLREMKAPDNMRLGGRHIGTALESRVERGLNRGIFERFSDLTDLAGRTARVSINLENSLEVKFA